MSAFARHNPEPGAPRLPDGHSAHRHFSPRGDCAHGCRACLRSSTLPYPEWACRACACFHQTVLLLATLSTAPTVWALEGPLAPSRMLGRMRLSWEPQEASEVPYCQAEAWPLYSLLNDSLLNSKFVTWRAGGRV